MKKLLFIFSALLLSLSGQAQTWSLDNSHAKLSFSIVHLMVSEQEGSFKKFNSKITSSKEDFSDASIELTADVNSIDTDNESRDQHLKAPDYFDAAKFSTLTFKSKSFTKVDGKKYKLVGDLTIKGVTKTVSFDVTYFGTITHPKSKKQIAGFKLTGVIKRSDFGVGPENSTSLGDEVTITSNLEFVKD
jgi:polyisoprenoid-binding protein YceI